MRVIEKIKNPSLGLFLIRLALGIVFIAHGWSKFGNMDQTIGFFGSLGLPSVVAYLVAIVELLGGIAMIVGFYTTTFGFLLSIVMVGAIFLVKIGKMDAGLIGGYELELTLLAASLAVALVGAGKFSVSKK